jgi:hypothetical protein
VLVGGLEAGGLHLVESLCEHLIEARFGALTPEQAHDRLFN